MKKLYELLKLKRSVGDVGIEIEVEGKNLNPIDSDTWKTENDGSLRGSFPEECSEYVLTKPISIRKVADALDELINHQAEAKLNFSYRCNVHVHINVCDMTQDQFLAFLYLAVLMEEPLMNMCGESRKNNRFCLRISDAEGYMGYVSRLFAYGVDEVKRMDKDSIRYAAINIASVKSYGSLEFRGMRGTLDKDVILPWVQSLYRIREFAKKLGNPTAVHDLFVETGNQQFAKKCLGVNYKHFKSEECEAEINRSYSLSIDLPHLYNKAKTEAVIAKLKKGDVMIMDKYVNNPGFIIKPEDVFFGNAIAPIPFPDPVGGRLKFVPLLQPKKYGEFIRLYPEIVNNRIIYQPNDIDYVIGYYVDQFNIQ